MRRINAASAILVCVVAVASHATRVLSAQNAPTPSALARASLPVAEPSSESVPTVSITTTSGRRDRQKSAPWWAPAASVVVPGAGQFAMGQQRSVAYLVAEGFLIVQAVAAQRNSNRDRDEYRSLASDVARRPFGGTRPDGIWDYYELMEKFVESGAFSKATSGAVIPETDTSTYNGKSWELARQNNWRDPNITPATTSTEYQRALAFYSARAIRDAYRWSWRDAQLQQDLFKQTIASANRNAKRATNLVSLLSANHLTSLIDAYVTVRVRRYGGVRVGSLQLDGVRTAVEPVGDPALGQRRVRASLRFVPAPR